VTKSKTERLYFRENDFGHAYKSNTYYVMGWSTLKRWVREGGKERVGKQKRWKRREKPKKKREYRNYRYLVKRTFGKGKKSLRKKGAGGEGNSGNVPRN